MSDLLGYYVDASKDVFRRLQERFGGQLQGMSYEQKIVMRAALADYVSNKPVWQVQGNSISLIDLCIESAGVDWGIWNEDHEGGDSELVGFITDCSKLDLESIEGLIEALTSQIRSKIYSSRIEEWEVVSHLRTRVDRPNP